ncbi:MAG: hypothetical protein IJA77_09245 [Clostridia bacterium]|nr:hypothetical protein [Clostridia bacterium]
MAKVYDSSDMQRAVNVLNEAISSLDNAMKKLTLINLGGLQGLALAAIQKQIEARNQVLSAAKKSLQQSLSVIQSKQNVLK